MKGKISVFLVLCMVFVSIQAWASDNQEVGLREQGWTRFTEGTYTYAAQGLEGELTLSSLRVNTYSLNIETFRVDNFNACGFAGKCSENENGLVCIDADNAQVQVLVQAVQGGVQVICDDVTFFCGHRSNFTGKYILK